MSIDCPADDRVIPNVAFLMSDDLKLDISYLMDLFAKVDSKYRQIDLRGRRIDVPTVQLKLVQRWIADFISCEASALPRFVTAYEAKSSIAINAAFHSKSKHILHLDIEKCFHSCTYDEVFEVLRNISIFDTSVGSKRWMNREELDFLSTLATVKHKSERVRHLSIGSPCSPVLANRILLPIDYRIISQLQSDYIYTRYSDDICISSNEWIDIDYISDIVRTALKEYGFELNESKTKCMGPGYHKRITGITITDSGELSVGRKRKKRLESELYKYLVKGEGDPKYILGLISFCRSINSAFISRLLIKYSNYGAAALTPGGVMAVLQRDVQSQAGTNK